MNGESMAITSLENQYMTKERQNVVIILEDLDFIWDEKDLIRLREMYADGANIWQMNEVFQRENELEILLALIHLWKIGRIKGIDLKRVFGKTKKCQPEGS